MDEQSLWLVAVVHEDGEDGEWMDEYLVESDTAGGALDKVRRKVSDEDSIQAISIDIRYFGTADDIVR